MLLLLHFLFYFAKKYWNKFYSLYHYENFKQRDLQQTAYNPSLDIYFKEFMNPYKNVPTKPHFF